MLPTSKTQATFDYRKMSGLIYGNPKTGKSTFCSQLDSNNVLFLDTENGVKHLTVFRQAIDSWSKMVAVTNALLTEKHEFSLVVVDTIGALKIMAQEHVLAQLRCTSVNDRGFSAMGRGYGIVNNELQRVFTKLLSGNFGVYFIDHETTETVDTNGKPVNPETYRGETIERVTNALSGRPGNYLRGCCDLICRAYLTDDNQRMLQAAPSIDVVAGDRFGVLPPTMPLDATQFINKFRDAFASQNGARTTETDSPS